jgi:hypothetical protein
LRQVGTIKKLKFDIDFASLSIKGRASKGNLFLNIQLRKLKLKKREYLPYYQEKYGTMILSKIECDARRIIRNSDPMIKF